MAASLSTADLSDLAESWQLSLRAVRKSPATLKAYGNGVRAYLAWCDDQDLPAMERGTVRRRVADLLDAGAKPATARARQLAVRRFTAWLADEGEIDADPFLGVKPPKLDTTVVEPLTDEQLRSLLKACVPTRGADPAHRTAGRRVGRAPRQPATRLGPGVGQFPVRARVGTAL